MTRLLYAFALGWVLHITYLMGASDGAREAEARASFDREALVAEFRQSQTGSPS